MQLLLTSCSILTTSIPSNPTSTILYARRLPNSAPTRTRTRVKGCSARLITDPDSFQVGRLIGNYGFMNVTSYSGFQAGRDIEYSSEDFERMRVQDVGEGSVKIRLYDGKIVQGPLKGTPVVFKVYPGQRVGGFEGDMMAANELSAHSSLQGSSKGICQYLVVLLGGFETKTGEQWLAFRNDGKYSAADYVKIASEKNLRNSSSGKQMYWNPFEQEQMIKRRRFYVMKLLQGAMSGLAFMHDHDILHQSLGPSSIILNTVVEKDAAYLIPRLRDLAFSVDIRYSELEAESGTLSEGLWRRAIGAGAFTPMDKRVYGMADDIYEAGLLLAFLAFIPFCEAGTMDTLSIQRLLESTFRLDIGALRDYCLEDDRLQEAVKFLDLGDRAGWDLLQAMLNPEFRKRPTAQTVLNHRFMTAAVL